MLKVLSLAITLSPLVAAADTVQTPLPATVSAPADSRSLGLEGAPNFRDIGGYTTAEGHHVRWHRVYRSNELSRLTPADAKKASRLNIQTVIDLRTDEERQKAPSIWDQPPHDIYTSPKPTLAPVMHTIMAQASTPEGARSGIVEFYKQMPDSYRDEYAALFHRLAAGETPLLVHCTAGKDRTGVAVAVLLSTLGVPRQQVVGDYQLTEKYLIPPSANAAATTGPHAPTVTTGQLPEESRLILWRADPLYINAALESIDSEYGSVDKYVQKGLGISPSEIKSIKASLLQ